MSSSPIAPRAGSTPPETEVSARRRRPGAIAIDTTLVVLLLALLPQTLDLNEGARRFPIGTIAVLLALLLLDLAIELFPPVRRALAFLESDFVPTTPDAVVVDEVLHEQEVEQEEAAKREHNFRSIGPWAALAWLAALGAGMFFLGYVTVTPVFLALFFLWARVPLKVAIGITLTLSAFNYLVFYEFLGMT